MPSPIRREFPPMPRPQRIAFDHFEVDMRSGELRKNGSRIRLQAQPLETAGPLTPELRRSRVARRNLAANLGSRYFSSTSNTSLAAAVTRSGMPWAIQLKIPIHRDPS